MPRKSLTPLHLTSLPATEMPVKIHPATPKVQPPPWSHRKRWTSERRRKPRPCPSKRYPLRRRPPKSPLITPRSVTMSPSSTSGPIKPRCDSGTTAHWKLLLTNKSVQWRRWNWSGFCDMMSRRHRSAKSKLTRRCWKRSFTQHPALVFQGSILSILKTWNWPWSLYFGQHRLDFIFWGRK